MPESGARLSIHPVDRSDWLRLGAHFADHNYRQTWDFGELAAARVGARSEHVAIRDGARVVALADVRIKRLPLIGGGIAYVNGGPLTRDDVSYDPERFVAAIEAMRAEYAVRRGLALRVAPPVGPAPWNAALAEHLTRLGFAPAPTGRPYRTMVLAIDRPPADIRKSLRQKWRNCLNRSEKSELTVTAASDVASIERFASLFDEFVVRKGFHVDMDAQFYVEAQRRLPEPERFLVLLAERAGQLIGGHVSSAAGDTSVYLLGATSPEALKCNAAYLLQWHAIEHAKARGCRWYDLGGIDPEANPGVFHFKEGMGGEDVTAAGPAQFADGRRARLALYLEKRYRESAARRAAAREGAAPSR